LLHPSYTEEQPSFAKLLALRHAPACVFINHLNEVVYIHGNVRDYIDLTLLKTTFNIFSLIHEDLATTIKKGVRKVQQENKPVSFEDVPLFKDSSCLSVTINFVLDSSQAGYLTLIEFVAVPIKLKEQVSAGFVKEHTSLDESFTFFQALNDFKQDLFSVYDTFRSKAEKIKLPYTSTKDLLTQMEVASIILDADLYIKEVTPSAREYFNLLETDIGRPIHHFVHRFQYSAFLSDALTVLKTCQPIEKETKVNDEFYLMHILPFKDAEKLATGLTITFTNITRLKKANDELIDLAQELRIRNLEFEQSEKRWETLLNHSPDIISRFDQNLRHIFVNYALEKETGLPSEAFIGKDIIEANTLKQDQAIAIQEAIKAVFSTGQAKEQHFTHQTPKGVKYFYAKLVPEFSSEGSRVETVLLISRDITSLKMYELALEQKNQALESTNASLDNFVYAVAHDLRSPVIHLNFFIDLINRAEKEKEKEEYIHHFQGEVKRLGSTLEGLIEIIKIQHIENIVKRVSFAEAFAVIKSEFTQELAQAQAVLKTDFSDHPEIGYIEAYLFSILRNLMSNAIKYRAEDRTLTIHISVYHDTEYILLEFADNGQGIDLERYEEKLFKPFKRLTDKVEGRGIGLHMIKRMIEKNGGKIEVSSRVNKGTTFYIYLKEYAI
jgi:two-component system, chemotaxis family, CheB/CheR fusion protein